MRTQVALFSSHTHTHVIRESIILAFSWHHLTRSGVREQVCSLYKESSVCDWVWAWLDAALCLFPRTSSLCPLHLLSCVSKEANHHGALVERKYCTFVFCGNLCIQPVISAAWVILCGIFLKLLCICFVSDIDDSSLLSFLFNRLWVRGLAAFCLFFTAFFMACHHVEVGRKFFKTA